MNEFLVYKDSQGRCYKVTDVNISFIDKNTGEIKHTLTLDANLTKGAAEWPPEKHIDSI